MNTKDVIYELRTKNGLSQDDLAEKVFVTRQAVSRWENGETVPTTDSLKLLSNLFNVSINTLLGSPQKLVCQCCGMPLQDELIGRNQDGTLNEDYCKWCYADGTYTYSDMDDLINVCIPHMQKQGFKLYSGSLGRNGEKCQCLLAMYHPVYNYLHILSVSFLPQDLVSQKPVTLKADLSTFIPQHNIKNLFQEK